MGGNGSGLLEVKELSAGYGAVKVLWDVSVAVAEGEFVALIGANGAGKTTLLRVIAGMLGAQAGRVAFQGRPIANRPAHQIARLGIAHIPEGRRIFGPLSVEENLRAGGYSARGKLSKEGQRKLLGDMFDLFPILAERRAQRAETLSGGEQQMLAIARGLMSAPRLLLIDEPSLGLAPLIVQSLSEVLRGINERQGMSILLVEQNARIALSVAHRVYVLDRGRVVLQGTTGELASDERIKEIYIG